MIAWSRKRTLIAGVTLIVVTNAIALAGVAYNRSGEADSVLQLTQRELNPPYRDQHEDNGIELALSWRVISTKTRDDELDGYQWGNFDYGMPVWLDDAKLGALGFDLAAIKQEARQRDGYSRGRAKEVFLVLELDGPAYRQALQRAAEFEKRADELLAAKPARKELIEKANSVKQRVLEDHTQRSRLFVVDAGLDADALRAAYPDRKMYAIVRGYVEPSLYFETDKEAVRASVQVAVRRINVPHALRPVFLKRDPRPAAGSLKYTVDVAFGKRLEPWITSVSGAD